MAEEYKKQHIVPKRYLDRFGFEGDKKTLIGVKNVKNKGSLIFTRPTDDIGYVKNLYDVTDKDDEKYWEHYLADNFDSLCGNKLGNIISAITLSKNKATVIGENEKDILSKLINSQLMRVPENMDYVNRKYPEISNRVKTDFVKRFPKNRQGRVKNAVAKAELSPEKLKEIYLNRAFDRGLFEYGCDILKQKTWVAYYNSISDIMPFVTSDNPVIIIDNVNDKKGLFQVGINSSCSIIYFPLSPKVAIQVFSNIDSSIASLDGKKNNLDDISFIMNMNRLIFEQAYQHAFLPKSLLDEAISIK